VNPLVGHCGELMKHLRGGAAGSIEYKKPERFPVPALLL